MKKRGLNLSLRIFAIFLAIFAITLYLPNIIITISATESTEDTGCVESEPEIDSPEESEPETEMEFTGGMVEIPTQGGDQADIQVSPEVDVVIRDESGAYVLQSGVYAFENLGNSGLFMDIQQDKYLPGYHMQQYAANGNPAETFDRSCLFKITWRPSTNSYIIRSMLNNRLTFYFSGNEVLTKEIAPCDADVPNSDTFRLIYNVEEGYFVIQPYNSSKVVAANDTTASGMEGAPNSYLKRSTETDSGDQARWIAYKYAGEAQSSTHTVISPALTGGVMTIGETYTAKVYSWSTVIGKNTPYVTIHPDSEGMAFGNENGWDYVFVPVKAGSFKLRSSIRTDGTTTAYKNYYTSYTIIPNIDGETLFVKNVATEKYIDIEGPSKNDGAFIQQWQFNDKPQSKWIFEIQSGGYFTIKSQYSNKYIGVDPTNTEYIRQYSAIGNNTLWKLIETTSENYKLVCKSLEASGYVLATQSRTSGNGSNLMMTPYTDDDNYRDEWNLHGNVFFRNMKMNIGEEDCADIDDVIDSYDANAIDYSYTVVCSSVPNAVFVTNMFISADKEGVALVMADDEYNQYFFRIKVYAAEIDLTIYSTYRGGNSSQNGFGHTFIGIYNNSAHNITIGKVVVKPEEEISIGAWGVSPYAGIWYNKEYYLIHNGDDGYDGMVSLTESVSVSNASTISTRINNYGTYDVLTNNCSHFATGVWNQVATNKLSGTLISPEGVVNAIKAKSGYVVDRNVPIINYYGYYNSSTKNFVYSYGG